MNISLPSMLKWLAPMAAAILCFLLVQGDLLAQTPDKPGQPTGVRASPSGNQALEVTWTAPSGSTVTAYDVRSIRTDASDKTTASNWATVDNAWTSSDLKYKITGLDANESYDVQVRAVNGGTDGDWSDTATGTPLKIPGAPTGVSVEYGDESLDVEWSAPTGDATVTGYDITYRETPSGSWTTKRYGGSLSTLEYTISDLDNGTEYAVQVRALNEAGPGPWSTPAQKEIPRTVPDAPDDLDGTPGNGKISLNWTTPDNGGNRISKYELRYVRTDEPTKTDIDNWTTKGNIGAEGTVSHELTGLENGKSYDVIIRAHNNIDHGDWSNTVVEKPRTKPGSPTITTITNAATHGDSILTISWTAPSNDGGDTISRYDLRYIRSNAPDKTDPGLWVVKTGIWQTSGDLEYNLGDLPKGVEHDFKVRAANGAGEGPWSTTYPQTPKTAPGEPAILTLTPDDQELTVTWHAPSDTGGVAITGYDIRYIGSDESAVRKQVDTNWTQETFAGSLTDLEHTIDSLTNGTEYDVQVRAVNSHSPGEGTWSKTLKDAPRKKPYAPTLNALSPGVNALTLTWTVPAEDGGATITRYDLRYIETDDDETVDGNWHIERLIWASGDLEYTLKRLLNGTGYDVQVRAYNEAGEGPWSGTQSGTPRTTPGAPTIDSVTPGNTELTVAWSAPKANGGADVSSYNLRYIRTDADETVDSNWTVVADVGSTTNLEDTITGLSNGVEYDVQVQAVNAAGGGTWSATGTGTPRTTPSAPTLDNINSDDQSLTVFWFRPGDGGATITSYDLRYIRTDASETDKADDTKWTGRDSVWTSGNLQYTFSGLTNGTQYDLQMRAVNAAGEGDWSETRRGTPETVPAAPTVDSIEAGDTTLKVTWSPPTDLGGGTLESYDLRHIPNDATLAEKADPTEWTTETGVGSLNDRQETIDNLVNGVLYDVQLRAVTDVDPGPGPWSSTISGTPRTTPGPVGAPSLAPGNRALTVSWSTPDDDGGAAPTSYDLRYILSSASAADKDDATKWTEETGVGTSSSLQETITGLDNGAGYDVQVRAVNPAGDGTWSATSSATPRTTPSAPTIDTVTSGSAQLTVAWGTSPDNGGDAVTSYDLRYIESEAASKDDRLWDEVTGAGSLNSRVAIIISLTNGTEYEVQVRAVNGAGGGAWSASGFGTPAATGAPTNIQLTATRTSITVTWDPPTGIPNNVTVNGYQVRYIRTDASDRSSDNWDLFNINGNPLAETKTISGLSSGIEYDVQVRSKTDTGHGAWSTIESVTTTGGTSGSNRPVSPPRPPPPPPPPPGGTTPPGTTVPPQVAQNLPGTPTVNSVTAGETSLAVAWTAPAQGNAPAVTNYDVRSIRTDADETQNSNWALRENVWSGSGSLEYTITGLDSGTEI